MPNKPLRQPAVDHDKPSTSVRGMLAVFSLGLGSFASVTVEFLPVGILPRVAADFGVSAGKAGWMMSVPGVLAALAAPGVMLLAGRADRRRVLLALSAILLASCLLAAWSPSFEILLLSRALLGISLGAFWALALAVAGRLVASSELHRAVGMVFAGVTVAMVMGVPIGTLVSELSSWRGAFLVAGVIAAAALVLQAWALPPIPADKALRLAALVDFVRQPRARVSMALVALMFAAHFGTYTYVAPLMRQAGLGPTAITGVLLVFGLAGFGANAVATHFVARHLKRTLMSAQLLLLIALPVLPALNSPWLLGAVLIAWGVAWGMLPLCLSVWNVKVYGGSPEVASPMFTFTTQVAIAVGSGAGGAILDSEGLRAVFFAGGAAVVLAASMLYRATLPESHPSHRY